MNQVTAEKLNKLEEGVANAGGGVLVVTPARESPYALDHTWQEIHDAGGAVIMFNWDDENDYFVMSVTRMTVSESGYQVFFYNYELSDPVVYASNTADGYPTLYVEG